MKQIFYKMTSGWPLSSHYQIPWLFQTFQANIYGVSTLATWEPIGQISGMQEHISRDFSLTTLKFPAFFRFSRWVATLRLASKLVFSNTLTVNRLWTQCKAQAEMIKHCMRTVCRVRFPDTFASSSSSAAAAAEGRWLAGAERFHFLPLRRYDDSRSSSVLSKLMSDGERIDAEASPIGSKPLE